MVFIFLAYFTLYNGLHFQVGCMRQVLDLVHWEDPEGLGREGGGRRDRDGEHM